MPYTNLSSISNIDEAGVANMKVSEILQVKGNILYTVTPDQPLVDAVTTMSENDIGSLVVMEYGDLVGMLTFREVLKALHANGGSVGAGTVRRHMDDSPITVTPDDTAALDGTQEASVSLGLTSQTRKDVLSVPLGALVALTSEQFGVEVVDEAGTVTRVPVTVGMFAGDRVEVSGDDIAEGQRVVVPNR